MSEKIDKSISNDELFENSQKAQANQTAILRPGQAHTFYGIEGRNYVVNVTNLDDSYTANDVSIYDGDWGHLVKKMSIEPGRKDATPAKMEKQNGIRVYNLSNQPSPGRPKVFVTLYHG